MNNLIDFVNNCQRSEATSTKYEQSIRAMRELAREIEADSIEVLLKELKSIPETMKETIAAYLLGHRIDVPFARGTLPSKYSVPLYHCYPKLSKKNVLFLQSRVVISDLTDLFLFPNGPTAITCMMALSSYLADAWTAREVSEELANTVPLPRLLYNSPGYDPKFARLEVFDAVNLCYKLGDYTYACVIN